MAAILLIHGGWHGAWCWYKLVPRLEQLGHTVTAIDLPGHGRNQIGRPPTLADYELAVVRTLEASAEPSIVVAHSMGGVVLQRVCELVPQLIREAVYLTAIVARDGESLASEMARDEGSLARPLLVASDDGQWVTLARNGLGDAFYHDCSAEDLALADLCLTAQAALLGVTTIHVSNARFGSVPRTYIECTADRSTTIAQQRYYQSAYPPARVLQLDASHSPFLSRPDELAALVDRIVDRT